MAKSAFGSVIAGGIAAGATYLVYQLALVGSFGDEAKAQALAIQAIIFPKPKFGGTPRSDPGIPLPPVQHDCPFITGDRYVFESGSPPTWTVVWRGQSVYTSGVQGFAENKYNDLCASDPY